MASTDIEQHFERELARLVDQLGDGIKDTPFVPNTTIAAPQHVSSSTYALETIMPGVQVDKTDKDMAPRELDVPARRAFLGLRADVDISDEVRARTLPSSRQYIGVNASANEDGFAQGGTLVRRQTGQEANMETRSLPVDKLQNFRTVIDMGGSTGPSQRSHRTHNMRGFTGTDTVLPQKADPYSLQDPMNNERSNLKLFRRDVVATADPEDPSRVINKPSRRDRGISSAVPNVMASAMKQNEFYVEKDWTNARRVPDIAELLEDIKDARPMVSTRGVDNYYIAAEDAVGRGLGGDTRMRGDHENRRQGHDRSFMTNQAAVDMFQIAYDADTRKNLKDARAKSGADDATYEPGPERVGKREKKFIPMADAVVMAKRQTFDAPQSSSVYDEVPGGNTDGISRATLYAKNPYAIAY